MTFPSGKTFTAGSGLEMVRIESGLFRMGCADGDLDEAPVRGVSITKPFYMAKDPVTNAQYELFDPKHAMLRGKKGFSLADDEPVLFVSWEEASAYCRWLAGKDGLPFRLPTEAEWEYACRAGTDTAYSTGDQLPDAFQRNQINSWHPDPDRPKERILVDLETKSIPVNPWGLRALHGIVEEWCLDWYGPYDEKSAIDPIGPASGDFRVSRGGSHSTLLPYLRSASRMAALPGERSWYIGFRVVLGEMPKSSYSAKPADTLVHSQVSQAKAPPPAPAVQKPYFLEPRPFVILTPAVKGPFFHHNHVPAITECPNGDLLAIWFTCEKEEGRELRIVGSRLRHGKKEWEPASYFWCPPDRNATGSALFTDSDGTIFHWNGMSAAGTWGNEVLVQRTSKDNGATWSAATIVQTEHGLRHMPIACPIKTRKGALILPCDAVTIGQGGTALQVSHDGGTTWTDTGGTIAGIHAPIVELTDGRILAFGRGDAIAGRMAKSISSDLGKTWTYSASEFDPISGGQRGIFIRLDSGAIFFACFARTLVFRDAAGKERVGRGLFGALSNDEGETWPVKKLITPGGMARKCNGGAWTGAFILGPDMAEPMGYLTAIQTRDSMINLISSAQHYAFNEKWLREPAPAVNP